MSGFQRTREFFVGVDSDGCVFDTMELKHKECFIPNIINTYQLQGVSKYARETAEFINLYSAQRGINRFPGLVETLKLLKRRPEVIARKVEITIPTHLEAWVQQTDKLSNPALEQALQAAPHPELELALEWSNAVNEQISKFVRNVPPFPFVQQSLAEMAKHADLIVASATPYEALQREWEEHGIAEFMTEICGQEAGNKQQILERASQYDAGKALMIGDALGDYRAAAHHGVLFYPINPGAEEESWQRFYEEGFQRFLEGTFAGQYQQELMDAFHQRLPEQPPFAVRDA